MRLLLLIVTLSLILGCSKDSTPSGVGNPATPKPSIAKLNKKVIVGKPIEAAIGDWDSQGAPSPPPPPYTGRYLYECRAFLQDQLNRKGYLCENCEEEFQYKLYRLYKFSLSDENPRVNFSDLDFQQIAYFGMKLGRENQTYEVDEDLDLENPFVEISVHAYESYQEQVKKGKLSAYLSLGQKLSDKMVFNFEHTEHLIEKGGFSLSLSVDIRAEDGSYLSDYPRAFIEIDCMTSTPQETRSL